MVFFPSISAACNAWTLPAAQPIIPPDLREKPRSPVNSNVRGDLAISRSDIHNHVFLHILS